jgi:hypothetical protein
MVFLINYVFRSLSAEEADIRLSNTNKILAFPQCFVKGCGKDYILVDYLLNSWNQVITELKQWQELRAIMASL